METEPIPLVPCPTCGHNVSRQAAQCPQCAQPFGLGSQGTTEHAALKERVGKIQRMAYSFVSVAIFMVIVAMLAFIFGLSGGGGVAWMICGIGFSLAVWLYLIANIIHVRANTEK